jgi:hypothetical protein
METYKKASETMWTLHISSSITNHTCAVEDRTRAAFVGVQTLIILTLPVLHEIYSEYEVNTMCDSKDIQPFNAGKTWHK